MHALLYADENGACRVGMMAQAVCEKFNGFTLVTAEKYIKGKPIKSLVLHVSTLLPTKPGQESWKCEVKGMAHTVRVILEQESVLVCFSDGETYLAIGA